MTSSRALPWLLAACVAVPALAQQETGQQGLVDALRPAPGATRHPILTPAFQRTTDLATGYPLTAGNGFELLETGAVSFPRKLALIRGARRSVCFTTMIAFDDDTGRAFRRELAAAAARGVDVRCIVDGALVDPRFVLRLRRDGVRVARFNQLLARDRQFRLHIKTLVVDSRHAVLGGMNMTDSYNLGDGENRFFKDTDLLVHGDAALQAARHFEALWRELRPRSTPLVIEAGQPAAPSPDDAGLARFIVQESDLGQTTIRDYYTRCFEQARERIIWHVNNLNPNGPTAEALIAAAARGVRVVCITHSVRATSGLYGEWIGREWYRRLNRNRRRFLESGIELWELDVPVHSKALVVDGVMASIGSYNVGSAKSDVNLESTFVVYEPALVAQVEAMLRRDLARAHPAPGSQAALAVTR